MRNYYQEKNELNKIIILGIDGLDPYFVKKFIEKGIMRNLKRYIGKSYFTKMLSTIPPLTIPAWASMFTGLDQKQLKAYDMFRIKGNFDIEFLTNDVWKGEYLWDILSLFNIKMGVMFFPFLFRPYPINGFMITDPVLGKIKTYPPSLDLNLAGLIEFKALHNILPSLMIHDSKKNLQYKMKILRELERKNNYWQVLFLQDGLTDISMHQGNFKDIIEAYSLVDELMGLAFEICESNNWNLLIVSDHGCQRMKWILSISNYLIAKGFVKQYTVNFTTKLSLALYQLLLSKLARVDPKLTRTLINLIKYLRTKSSRNSKNGAIQFYDKNSAIIPYFSGGSNFANLWINKEAYQNDIQRGLCGFDDSPILRKICQKIYYDYNSTKDDEYLVPLTLEFLRGIQPDYLPLSKIIFRTKGFMHSKYATFIAYGSNIRSMVSEHIINIIDFFPTLLALVHVPIPNDRHGRIITEMFKSSDVIKIQYIPKSKISIMMKLKRFKNKLLYK